MRKSMLLLTSFLFSLVALGQAEKKAKTPCDSLLGKSYSFLYDTAAAIVEGRMLTSTKYKEGNEFEVLSNHNFKGGVYSFKFFQKESPHWFSFEKDSNYVFLVFPEYNDPVFSPCILFGKKNKMEGLLSYADSQCKVLPPSGKGCTKQEDEVCGCNGVTYGNPCLAEQQGVYTYTYGRCGKP